MIRARPRLAENRRRGTFATLATIWVAAAATAVAEGEADDDGLWSAHVRPLLEARCTKCHGAAARKAGLDLRRPESIRAGAKSGPVVIPGKPEESSLYRVLIAGPDDRMPLDDAPLSREEIAIIERWIRGGATTGGREPRTEQQPRSVATTSEALPPAGLTPGLVIDLLIEEGWQRRGVRPAVRADDRAFARRLYLDLAGRIPTTEELAAFERDTRSEKRERLIAELLGGPEYPRHFRDVFDVALLGRSDRRAAERRKSNRWHSYLEWAFAANRPWSEIVRDLVVARPESDDQRGAAWFLFAAKDKHRAMAERVAPALLGLQVQCAQCHDHPLASEIEQRHYWGLVSFFERTKNASSPQGIALAESAIGGYSKYADLDGESHESVLAFFDGTVVPENRPEDPKKEKDSAENYVVPPADLAGDKDARAVAVPKFSRREELFRVALTSGLVGKAFVNRVWALLMGRGLVHPVDKMDSIHPPSHPRLLAWLTRDFIANGYDVRRLVRAIVTSRAYQLDSRPRDGKSTPPEAFAVAMAKPLGAEALQRSWFVATGRGETSVDALEIADSFGRVFPALFAEENTAELKQALFLSNNPEIDRLLAAEKGTTVERLLALDTTERRVRLAFETMFARTPDSEELGRAAAFLDARRESPERERAGIEQFLWALLTSAEFRFNH